MRVAAISTLVTLTIAFAAPAHACAREGPSVTYFTETPPKDLEPNELVLEVRFMSREPYKTPPFFGLGDRVIMQGAVTDRLAVVRVVHGRFKGDAILIPISPMCGGIATRPSTGAETGLVVGFVTPPAPDWNDAPALVARTRIMRSDLDAPEGPLLTDTLRTLPRLTYQSPPKVAEPSDPASLMGQARVARDPAVAMELFERAVAILRTRADAGDTSAMIDIGGAMRARAPSYMARVGPLTFTPQPDAAVEWFERAAALGDAKAMFLLGQSYQRRGVQAPDRLEMATHWYLKAAEAGHACAMGTMAQRYRFGQGVPVDEDKALAWYHKATAAGVIMSPYGYEIQGPRPKDDPLPQLQCPGSP